MNRLIRTTAAVVVGLTLWTSGEEPRGLAFWDFSKEEDREWTRHANCSKDVLIEDGVLKGTMTGWDPFLTSPAFTVDAKAGQFVEIRAKTTAGGDGNLFWVPVGATGAQQKWSVSMDWIGDNEWHEYRVYPFWQGEKRIARLRMDFAVPRNDAGTFEVDWIRIGDAIVGSTSNRAWSGASLTSWSPINGATVAEQDGATVFVSKTLGGALASDNLKIPAAEAFVVAVEMAAKKGDSGCVMWASDSVSGLQRKNFRIKPDGAFHTYNIDLGSQKNWTGNIVLLQLAPVLGNYAKTLIRSVKVSDEPQGGADVSVNQVRLADAINRAGRPLSFLIQFSNTGGQDAKNITLDVKKWPRGVSVLSAPGWENVPEIPASGIVTHTIRIMAKDAVSGDVELTLSGDGISGQRVNVPIEVLPDRKLKKSDYVPVPKPVQSDYEMGALYISPAGQRLMRGRAFGLWRRNVSRCWDGMTKRIRKWWIGRSNGLLKTV